MNLTHEEKLFIFDCISRRRIELYDSRHKESESYKMSVDIAAKFIRGIEKE